MSRAQPPDTTRHVTRTQLSRRPKGAPWYWSIMYFFGTCWHGCKTNRYRDPPKGARHRPKPEPEDPWIAKWCYMRRRHKLLYLIYILPLLDLVFACTLLAWIPWMIFKSCRPSRFETTDGKKIREKIDFHGDKLLDRDLWAPWTYGDERYGYWNGWWLRCWDMYGFLRGCWHTVRRQGLQLGGVMCGLSIILFQAEIVGHDTVSQNYGKVIDELTSGGDTSQSTSDPTCAYALGTSIANWGGEFENLAWYCMYHGWLILLCFMLIGDEVFNVRMGCFAPQWSRAGIGYTIMFTVNTSPLYGVVPVIRLRYVHLIFIFVFGVYNVFKTFLASSGCIDDPAESASVYRYGRHPLRPWTEELWETANERGNFLMRDTKKSTKKSLFWTERWQTKIGDHAWPARQVAHDMKHGIDALPKRLIKPGETEHEEKMILAKTKEQKRREEGWLGRGWVHCSIVSFPPHTEEQMLMRQRYYLADEYKWDKLKIVNGKLENPTEDELNDKTGKLPKGQEWEHTDDFAKRRTRDLKQGAGYWGLEDWEPVPCDDQRDQYAWYFWFDIRRWYAAGCAVAMILVHVMLMMYNLGYGYSNWPTYRAQYDDAEKTWLANGGPRADQCQFDQGSSMPIWIKAGDGSITGVTATMTFYVFWELFIIHLCLGIFFVALSNNRAWGMHLPWPITLVGPRLSSVSIGWTLGLVGSATLQLGFFNFNTPQLWIARLSGYACIAGWAIYILTRNELMRNFTIRHPFSRRLSRTMLYYMDDKKYRRHLADYDDDVEGIEG